MIYLALISFSILRGLNTTSVKIAQKGFIKKTSQSFYMTVLLSLFQAVFLFLIPPYYRYSFSFKMVLYPLLYSVFYVAGYILLINSLNSGPASLTNIINSFQLLVPIIVGLVLWKESITLYQIAGLILFGIILWLFNQSSYKEGPTDQDTTQDNPQGEQEDVQEYSAGKVTVKWALTAVGSALFIGIAVIFTKQYMLTYQSSIKEYLIAYNLIVVLLGSPYLSVLKLRGKLEVVTDRKFMIYTAAAGFMQNITNIIYMYYITKFKSASFFPLIGILNIISIVLMSRLLLKEKISRHAYLGVLLSIIAIYLLGIK